MQILDTKRSKNLNVELIKVKGHSSDYWNDKVDELAKEDNLLENVSSNILFLQSHDPNTSQRGIIKRALSNAFLKLALMITTSYDSINKNVSRELRNTNEYLMLSLSIAKLQNIAIQS
ncbi:33115_t:CDS:2 [Gigaspora margarita]|uniref:33115_t:CDS:1 n=1 Tax=Gigaspora margarita TaxID=4874 RepID=A0ABM8W3A6_GIGMA|nr:33115_t:CDS:2 [Gigaspora margarita]